MQQHGIISSWRDAIILQVRVGHRVDHVSDYPPSIFDLSSCPPFFNTHRFRRNITNEKIMTPDKNNIQVVMYSVTTSIKISLQNPQVLKLNKILFYTSQKQKKMSDLRPYFIQIVKHEEKGDRFARVNMELLTTPRKEPFNPFVKTDMPSQSYPSCLRPACPRKPGCGACGSCCPQIILYNMGT